MHAQVYIHRDIVYIVGMLGKYINNPKMDQMGFYGIYLKLKSKCSHRGHWISWRP